MRKVIVYQLNEMISRATKQQSDNLLVRAAIPVQFLGKPRRSSPRQFEYHNWSWFGILLQFALLTTQYPIETNHCCENDAEYDNMTTAPVQNSVHVAPEQR